MAYDLEEQEQLDEFKAWWKLYGKLLINAAIVLLLAYAVFQGWTYYRSNQAIAASTHYQELLVTDAKDLKLIQDKAAVLMDKYSATPYAGRAALFAAKANYQMNDAKSAKNQLKWAVSHAVETSTVAMASLQLANILMEEKDLEGALKVLAAPHDTGFDGLFADLKGDVLIAMGKVEEAKLAYKEALVKLDPQGKYRFITKQKLDSLG